MKITSRGSRGFSLNGLLAAFAILIAFVAILLVIALPGISASVRRGNEIKAIALITEIKQAQAEYSRRRGEYGTLEDLDAAGLLSEELADGRSPGYTVSLSKTRAGHDGRPAFQVTAIPTSLTTGGDSSFYVNERSGVYKRVGNVPPQAGADRMPDGILLDH